MRMRAEPTAALPNPATVTRMQRTAPPRASRLPKTSAAPPPALLRHAGRLRDGTWRGYGSRWDGAVLAAGRCVDRQCRAGQRAQRGGAEGDDDGRLDRSDLLLQPDMAGVDL